MLLSLANTSQAPLAVQLLVMLATAALVATLFRRFKLELIPGYLMAGVLVGPHAIGIVRDPAAVESISQLAIILLMFAIGLHLDVSSIRRGSRSCRGRNRSRGARSGFLLYRLRCSRLWCRSSFTCFRHGWLQLNVLRIRCWCVA